MLTLADLHKGQSAHITQLLSDTQAQRDFLRRMMQLGFNAGIPVSIVHEGLFGRDPISVRVGQHQVAMRRSEARHIQVEYAA